MRSPLLSAALIPFLVIADALPVDPATAKSTLGSIRGTVGDTSCGAGGPLAFAQVAVLGTRRGALTAEDGTYSIDGLEPGAYEMRAFWIGCNPVTRHAVEVKPGQVTKIDFPLSRRSDWRPPPDQSAECDSICSVHRQRMTRVLLPASYGLKVTRPDEEIRRVSFPNASFVWDAGCVIGGANAAWDYRCLSCIEEWNRRKGDGGERIASVSDTSWRQYSLGSQLSFHAPELRPAFSSSDSCFLREGWAQGRLRIRAYLGDGRRMPKDDQATFSVHGEIIDGQLTDVRMTSKGQSRTLFTYFVLPDSPNFVRLEVFSEDKDDLPILATILRSFRLSSDSRERRRDDQ